MALVRCLGVFAFACAPLAVACVTTRSFEDAGLEATGGEPGSSAAGDSPGGTAGEGSKGDSPSGGGNHSGEGGIPPTSGATSGAGQGEGGDGGQRAESFKSLTVDVVFPGDHGAAIQVTGPNGFQTTLTETSTLSDLPSGVYEISAQPVLTPSEIVGEVFDVTVVGSPATVDSESAATVSVTYSRRPGTGRLLAVDGARSLASISAEELAATGSSEATLPPLVLPDVNAQSTAVTPDAAGNVWVADYNGTLSRFSAAQLETGGEQAPELTLSVDASQVLGAPSPTSMVHGSDGSLFVAYYNERVVRLAPGQLTHDATVKAASVYALADLRGLQQIALDDDGGLWFAAYDASVVGRLSASSVVAGTAELSARWDGGAGSAIDGPTGIAFAPNGLLWVASSKSQQLSAFAADATTLIEPLVTITSSVLTRPGMMAFDASGNLWIANYDPGKVLRFAAADLETSGDKQPSLVLQSGALPRLANLAFNPASSSGLILDPGKRPVDASHARRTPH